LALLVIRPGASTTVQDRGRVGYRGFGVPVGGAFDRRSLDLANALLGNDPESAALEMTLFGGQYRAEVPLAIALAGAPMSASILGPSSAERPLAIPQSTTLLAGEDIVIGGSTIGSRTYLAVRGGWRTPLVLGSRSTESRLRAGDVLDAESSFTWDRRPVEWPWLVSSLERPLRVIDGPDADPTPGDARVLESCDYRVSERSDRMGLRLEGPTVPLEADPDRPSAPVAPGAVQVAGGRPIVLGVAGGTMGGYHHLAHVISADLDRLAQLRPGDPVTFRRVAIEEARRIDRLDRLARATYLARIATICGTEDGAIG
jgi:biotin-dependent carboxylase-like uncharacterized protein